MALMTAAARWIMAAVDETLQREVAAEIKRRGSVKPTARVA